MADSNYHQRLDDEAQALWVRRMIETEDAGIDPDHCCNVLLIAAALSWASVVCWDGTDDPIPDERFREITADFEAALLKEAERSAAARLSDETRGRAALLDRQLKLKCGLPVDGSA